MSSFGPVKLLCLILSVYVLLLAARPCCTDNDCTAKTKEQKELSGNSPMKEKECNACSPFFTCGSCTGFIIVASGSVNLIAHAEAPAVYHDNYHQPLIEEVALAIWQPPKLS